MRKPQVFIGCSSQGLEVAEAVQRNLSRDHEVVPWNQGLFGLGRSVLDGLVEILADRDYAVFVLRGDDVQLQEGESEPVARANVLFELGMAIGRIGRSRTFMLYDTHSKPLIISDLKGVLWAEYDGSSRIALVQSVATACTDIRNAIKERDEGEVWYTEWQMGEKKYVERLRLTIEPETSRGNPVCRVVGVREYTKVGGDPQLFRVVGTAAGGLYWLEYHTVDGEGGGTIFLMPSGTKMHGIISAGHCDAPVMRAYSNGWVRDRNAGLYNAKWLETRAIFQPRLPEGD